MKTARQYLIAGGGILLFILGFVLIKSFPQPQGMMLALPYLCIGVGCGLFGHGLGDIINRRVLQSDPALARRREVEERDERNVSHANRARARGFSMMTYVFAALMLAYALMGASPEIVIPFVIAYLFVHGYAVWFRLKLDRED